MACLAVKRPLELDPLEALHSPYRPANKRPRCTPVKHSQRESSSSVSQPSQPSIFNESALSTADIANQLRDELKRLRRRRQIFGDESAMNGPASPCSPGRPNSPPDMMMEASSSSTAESLPKPSSSAVLEKPIFTLQQMTLICERMCKERTDKVREEYDKILQQKLSEQYDAFVKFIDHQIQARFSQSQLPSYLS